MFFSFKKKRTKRNLPFCTACTINYEGISDVISSQYDLAMHPEVSGYIDAPLDEANMVQHWCCEGSKKAGVKGIGGVVLIQ